ncbi:MAG TPA: hypothetical protein VKU87_04090 [Thermomicrobiaceae bacterium]|nr:hypothetical protein [Thermomicrobiaceae bacterium]
MSVNGSDPGAGNGKPAGGNLWPLWKEAGRLLGELISRFTSAFRAAWGQEKALDSGVSGEKVSDDVRVLARRIDRAARAAASQTEDERKRAFDATSEATSRSYQEARSATEAGVRDLNRKLKKDE